MRIQCIVEGHGDRDAVPIVIRRIANEVDPTLPIDVPQPIRIPKTKLLKDGELERAVKLAGLNAGNRGAVLVIIDSDDHCPAKTGPGLLARAKKARNDIPLAVVLAKREFESWFLAAVESLRGNRGLPGDLQTPLDPEAIQGAKEWLTDRMGKYVETLDQPAFAAIFDFRLARHADSFDKFYREVVDLLKQSQTEIV